MGRAVAHDMADCFRSTRCSLEYCFQLTLHDHGAGSDVALRGRSARWSDGFLSGR